MYRSFFRLFTIVLGNSNLSQSEVLLLSKLFIMFKISFSVTTLNSILILVGYRRCSLIVEKKVLKSWQCLLIDL